MLDTRANVKYKVKAVSGDLAKGGLRKTAKTLMLTSQQIDEVMTYQALTVIGANCKVPQLTNALLNETYKCREALMEKLKAENGGPFEDKYYFRTKWEVV